MSQPSSWLARVSVCVAVAALSFTAVPAFANGLVEQQTFQIRSNEGQPVRVSVSTRDLECLTEALYHEARGEGVQGQRAVAEVILNRVDNPRFPKSVCGVINQSGQFSYKGRVGRVSERGAYNRAKNIAVSALSGAPRNLTGGATYFHTRAVRPSWSRKFTRTTQIGSHIFYRTGGAQRVASN